MKTKALFFLSGFIIKYSSANFFNVDTSLDPNLINQNQVFLNRKEKFIKFDTKDNALEELPGTLSPRTVQDSNTLNIFRLLPFCVVWKLRELPSSKDWSYAVFQFEHWDLIKLFLNYWPFIILSFFSYDALTGVRIELGISIPFIKVPLTTSKHLSEAEDSKISVNAPGLIVAGMLMLTSFLIIPLLFTTTSEHSFGFQRKVKQDMWSKLEEVNEVLSKNGIDSSSCMQKSICWIAKTSKGGKEGSIGKWVNYFLKTWWLSRLIGGTFIEDAVEAASRDASCEATYSHCSITNKHLHSFAKMVAANHY